MSETSSYTVKINRREGAVEITGADKEWIAEQLDKLSVVFAVDSPAPLVGTEDEPAATSNGAKRAGAATGKGRKRGGAAKTKGKIESEVPDKLTADMQQALAAFQKERGDHWDSAQNQAAIIAYFLTEKLGFDGISADDLAAVYPIMGWRAPVNPRAVINNARDRKGYFQSWKDGRSSLSVTGRNFVLHDALEAKDA